MKKILLTILGLLFVLALLVFLKTTNKPSVKIDSKTFYVYVASSDEQKAKGLAIFTTLPENEGMIFPFSSSDYYAFWMKDMRFPIDIIYIEKNKIVDIFPNVPQPNSSLDQLPIYKPDKKANYVLEINAGLAKKYKFKNGDLVRINI